MSQQNPMNQRPQRPPVQGPEDEDQGVSRVMRNVLIWVAILVSLIMVGMFMANQKKNEWPLTYNEYMQVVKEDRVQYATVTKSQLNDFEFPGTS